MKVSVVIPTCDRAPLLKKCVVSVMDQSYTPHEIIIIDNGNERVQRGMLPDIDLIKLKRCLPKFGVSQARNFGGSSKGDWKLELKGKSAAQGKIQGAVLIELLKNAGFTNISQFKIPTWAESAPGKSKAQEDITDEIYKLLKEYSATKFDKSQKAEVNNKAQIALQDKSWRYSKLAGLRFLDWLTKCKDPDMAMKEIYLYASSQSDKSSVYYKLQ